MARPLMLHEDRLFPPELAARSAARRLCAEVTDLPNIIPYGHTDPSWLALNQPFSSATELSLAPDHYLCRMLYSQGIPWRAWECRAGRACRAPPRGMPGRSSRRTSTCSPL